MSGGATRIVAMVAGAFGKMKWWLPGTSWLICFALQSVGFRGFVVLVLMM
jgi:hypothetical protein